MDGDEIRGRVLGYMRLRTGVIGFEGYKRGGSDVHNEGQSRPNEYAKEGRKLCMDMRGSCLENQRLAHN